MVCPLLSELVNPCSARMLLVRAEMASWCAAVRLGFCPVAGTVARVAVAGTENTALEVETLPCPGLFIALPRKLLLNFPGESAILITPARHPIRKPLLLRHPILLPVGDVGFDGLKVFGSRLPADTNLRSAASLSEGQEQRHPDGRNWSHFDASNRIDIAFHASGGKSVAAANGVAGAIAAPLQTS